MIPHQLTILRLLAVVMVVPLAAAEDPNGPKELPRLRPSAIYRLDVSEGNQVLVTQMPVLAPVLKSREASVAFLAVVAEEWPEGLVPLFGVVENGRFDLRRQPAKSQENFATPLFFALPPQNEEDATKIVGRWECVAKHADGSKKYLAFELAVEGGLLAGRFDQNTDYRVAFITGGTFRSNRIELKVGYIQERYKLTGDWRGGKLAGAWSHSENADHGTWEATRPERKPRLEQPSKPVPLYEWGRASDGARRYSIQTDLGEPGWERAARPLCYVWKK